DAAAGEGVGGRNKSGHGGQSAFSYLGHLYGVRTATSRRVDGEAFVGVEDPALDIGGFGRTTAEFLHPAHQAHPIEDLLLTAVLDRAQRPLPPSRVVAGLQRIVERPV